MNDGSDERETHVEVPNYAFLIFDVSSLNSGEEERVHDFFVEKKKWIQTGAHI